MLMPIHICEVDFRQVERSKDQSKGVPFDRKDEQLLPVKGSKRSSAMVHGGATKTG